MSTIIFGSTVSLVTSATPSEGGYIIGYDIDGIFKQKDSFGNITEVGGGPTAGISSTASLLDVLSIGNTTGPYDIIFGTGSKISSLNGSAEISLDEGSTSGLISISTDNGTDYSKIYVSPTFSQIRHSVGTTFSNLTIQKGDSILLTGDSDNFTTIRTSGDIFKVEFNRPSLLDGQIKIVESGTTYDTGSLNKAFLHLNTLGSTTDFGVQNSVIIGGQGISASESDSVYVPQLVIQNSKLIKGSTGGGVVDLTNGDVVLTNSSRDVTIGIFSPLSTSTWLSSSNGILVVDSSTGSTSPDVDGPNVFVSTRGSYLGPGIENSVIVGGIGLSGISSNTVYLGNSVNINGQFTLPSSDGATGQILKTDGLGNVTWQDETASSGTNSLDEILQEGNNTQVYDIIMGTGTGIRSSNTGGSIFLDSSGNPGEVVISTDNGSLLTSFIELSGDDILLNSSNGKLDINTFESNIISGDATGLKYSFDYSATFVTYSLVSKNYVDSKDISTFSASSGLTGSFSSGTLQVSTEVDPNSIEINTNNEISLKSTILGDRQFNSSVNILGNLTVLGTTSTINIKNLLVEDSFITLNATYSGPPIIDSGIEVNLGNGTYSKFYWDSSISYWVLGVSGSETEVITSAGIGLTKSNNQLLIDFNVVDTNGSFGISDINGKYTYYNTLVSALQAASSGEVVEVFSDFTETTDTAVLKDGVNINMNGHTYTFDSASTLNAMTNNNVLLECSIFNGTIIRTGGSNNPYDSAVIETTASTNGITTNILNLIGVTLINLNGTVITANAALTVNGPASIRSNGSFNSAIEVNNIFLNNCEIRNDNNCISGNDIRCNNCQISSQSGIAITGNFIALTNSEITGPDAVQSSTTIFAKNCLIAGFAGYAMYLNDGTANIEQCIMYSETNAAVAINRSAGITTSIFDNSIRTFFSPAISCIVDGGECIIKNNQIFNIVDGSDNYGIGVRVANTGTTCKVIGNTIYTSESSPLQIHGILAENDGTDPGNLYLIDNRIDVESADNTSFAIESTVGSAAINYIGNKMKTTSAPPIGVNVIQNQVNTLDNFGNIQI